MCRFYKLRILSWVSRVIRGDRGVHRTVVRWAWVISFISKFTFASSCCRSDDFFFFWFFTSGKRSIFLYWSNSSICWINRIASDYTWSWNLDLIRNFCFLMKNFTYYVFYSFSHCHPFCFIFKLCVFRFKF